MEAEPAAYAAVVALAPAVSVVGETAGAARVGVECSELGRLDTGKALWSPGPSPTLQMPSLSRDLRRQAHLSASQGGTVPAAEVRRAVAAGAWAAKQGKMEGTMAEEEMAVMTGVEEKEAWETGAEALELVKGVVVRGEGAMGAVATAAVVREVALMAVAMGEVVMAVAVRAVGWGRIPPSRHIGETASAKTAFGARRKADPACRSQPRSRPAAPMRTRHSPQS